MAVEEREEVIDQPGVRLIAGNGGFEDVGVADALHTPQRLLFLQALDHRPHRAECRPHLLWQSLMDLTDRARTARPEDFHDAELEPAQRGTPRHMSTTIVADLTTYVAEWQEE